MVAAVVAEVAVAVARIALDVRTEPAVAVAAVVAVAQVAAVGPVAVVGDRPSHSMHRTLWPTPKKAPVNVSAPSCARHAFIGAGLRELVQSRLEPGLVGSSRLLRLLE